MYNKLKINVDNVLERLYEAVRYIDLAKIKLLDKKMQIVLQLKK